MAVKTQKNNVLTLKIDDGTGTGAPNLVDVSCQVQDLEFSMPGEGDGQKVQVACKDGVVLEPGEPVDGSLTGTIFVDSTDTGVTYLLAKAWEAGREVAYELDYWPDLGATVGLKFTGLAKVGSFTLPFSKPGYAKQPLDLVIKTATIARTTP